MRSLHLSVFACRLPAGVSAPGPELSQRLAVRLVREAGAWKIDRVGAL